MSNDYIFENEKLATPVEKVIDKSQPESARFSDKSVNSTTPKNPIIGRTPMEFEQFYSNGNIGHFHWKKSDGQAMVKNTASSVEIPVLSGNVSCSPLGEQELASGDSLV